MIHGELSGIEAIAIGHLVASGITGSGLRGRTRRDRTLYSVSPDSTIIPSSSASARKALTSSRSGNWDGCLCLRTLPTNDLRYLFPYWLLLDRNASHYAEVHSKSSWTQPDPGNLVLSTSTSLLSVTQVKPKPLTNTTSARAR